MDGALPQVNEAPGAVIVSDNLTALGLVRSLAPLGVACTVCAWNALGPARYSRHARVVACAPPSAGRAFVDALLTIGRAFPQPPVLLVTDESSMLLVEHVREELSSHFLLTLPGPTQFGQVVSKAQLHDLAAAAGVPIPETWLCSGSAVPPGLPYPLVMKPTQRVVWAGEDRLRSFRQEFGCKALLVDSADRAQAFAARAYQLGFEMLLQRPVPGPVQHLLTAGVFAAADGARALFTARKLAQVPADFGDGSVVEGVRLPELQPYVWRLIDHAGFRGLADIEFKRDGLDGQLKLLDVNPRPWLWVELATRCGVNLPYLLYCDTVHRRSGPIPTQTAERVVWCSVRSLVRSLRQQGLWDCRPLLSGLVSVARGAGIEATLARDDLLWRMLLTPRFWRDAVRTARGQLA